MKGVSKLIFKYKDEILYISDYLKYNESDECDICKYLIEKGFTTKENIDVFLLENKNNI